MDFRTDNLAARVAHAASLGDNLWNIGDHRGSRNSTRHHGRQVAPRKRDNARRDARAFKAAQHAA